MISWNEAFQLVYTMIVLYFWDRKCHFSDLTLLNKQKKNNPKISKFGLSGQNLRENTRKNIQNHLILSNFEPVITGRCINGNSTEVLTSKIKLAVITMASNWTQRNSTVKFRVGKWKKVPCKSVYGRNHSSWGRIQGPETTRKWTHGPVRITSTRIASTGPVSSVG